MYCETLLILLLAVGGGYGKSCSYDSDCDGFYDGGTYCCNSGQCCYIKDSVFSITPKSCSGMYDCGGDKPYCCNNKQCCTFSDTTTEAASIATGVIVAICVVIALVIIGCCVGIVLCCRRQTTHGRVVRVPAAATTTTVHQTHTVMQPQPYQPGFQAHQPGMQAQYPPAPNKDQPPPYCPPTYAPGASSYPAMPQPAVNPSHGVPYPDGAPPYHMPAPVQQNLVQASAPPMILASW